MTSPFPNVLERLIQEGQLVKDLSIFSDHELRLGVMMLIDNLERFDETMSVLEFTSESWRKERQDESYIQEGWERTLKNWKSPHDPELAMTGRNPEVPWDGYQTCANGSTFQVKDLDRVGLERDIRNAWNHLERAREAARLMSRFCEQVKEGHWFDAREVNPQDEIKPNPAKRAKP